MSNYAIMRTIHERKRIRIRFYSPDEDAVVSTVCAPMDIGPVRGQSDTRDRYHLWDYGAPGRPPRRLVLRADQVISIEVLSENFDPREFVTWDTRKRPWFLRRDWGEVS